MKRSFLWIFLLVVFLLPLFADSDDDLFGGSYSSDDDLFGGSSDDELFGGFGGDDDFFFDDGIEEYTDVTAKSDLSKGVIFENGSVKIGGEISAGLSTSTVLYADDTKKDDDGNETKKTFGDHLKETTLSPKLSAFLTVDARPTEILRMYTKFGFAYPFKSTAISTAQTSIFPKSKPIVMENPLWDGINPSEKYIAIPAELAAYTQVENSITDYLKIKEIFTDFSLFDRAFFRFGIHTVTWGAGYFFSPVSDMINTSSIDPENPTLQVDGSLNLRTQIVFPGSQNCLWFYVIPSTDFTQGADSYLRDTALAGKADIMIKNWELGIGAFWKYQHAPKVMLTGTGSLKKVSVFGEFVYQYGADSEWEKDTDWDDKTSIFQATAGLSYYWKDPMITLAAQYYYDINKKDFVHQYLTYGHNIATVLSFGKILGNRDFSASIFGMMNFGKEDLPETIVAFFNANGVNTKSFLNAATFSATLNYTGLPNLSFGLGPYITWSSYDEKPVVSLKLTATLGGGRF